MAVYEFRCRECGSTFEVNRPMQQAGDPADCPDGHADTVKLLSTVALGGKARTAQPAMAPSGGGGGCCGGGCCGG
ncbi:FmdB family zinc ribbon protein [Actinomycetospora termitidis]|uniref:Zinc ribbon domain-containing protein n=1 Tax=Actinomycetospora termitidis TaxID=3053470 RepID=A0ABT7M327_9PSEU|nr:zinc ribbon domain-containing protein [Actinomycetospora sp. Odt1-22]MDL5154437.1 zinc ribbon domain-containing protein [Actinomycetospora sp. Odt1-22]